MRGGQSKNGVCRGRERAPDTAVAGLLGDKPLRRDNAPRTPPRVRRDRRLGAAGLDHQDDRALRGPRAMHNPLGNHHALPRRERNLALLQSLSEEDFDKPTLAPPKGRPEPPPPLPRPAAPGVAPTVEPSMPAPRRTRSPRSNDSFFLSGLKRWD